MKAGRAAAALAGVAVRRRERVVPLGAGWLIRGRGGFVPCPWAFDLAHFAAPMPGERALDLGTGGGVLLCALGLLQPGLRAALGVEMSAGALDRARRNLRLNRVVGGVARGDVRAAPVAPRAFDLVVGNPPFYPAAWGRQSEDDATARATHALAGDVGDFARAAAQALAPHGRLVFVYDAGHLPALLLAVGAAGLAVSAMRFLDDDRGKPARVLLRAQRGAGMAVTRTPFAGPEEWT